MPILITFLPRDHQHTCSRNVCISNARIYIPKHSSDRYVDVIAWALKRKRPILLTTGLTNHGIWYRAQYEYGTEQHHTGHAVSLIRLSIWPCPDRRLTANRTTQQSYLMNTSFGISSKPKCLRNELSSVVLVFLSVERALTCNYSLSPLKPYFCGKENTIQGSFMQFYAYAY